MNLIVPLLVLVSPGHGKIAKVSDAQQVYHCSFEHHADPRLDADVNFDSWPDGWKRKRGRGLPQYLKIGIRSNGAKGHHLQIDMDGGGATLLSPSLKVSTMSGYVLDANIRTIGLSRDDAYIELLFLDMHGQLIDRFTSEKFTGTSEWTGVRIGPLNFTDERIQRAVISLNVKPRGRREDLTGSAMFDDIWFGKLPRMTLSCQSSLNLISDPKNAKITCTISGCSTLDRHLRFELLDVYDRVIATARHSLADSEKGKGSSQSHPSRTVHWHPKLDYGYFRVQAWLEGGENQPLKRILPLCVINPRRAAEGGEFGWSLPDGNRPLTTKQLLPLLSNAGISRLKFPVWNESNNTDWAEKLAEFAARLEKSNVRTIGILDQPPGSMRKKFDRTSNRLPVASIFLEKKLWGPMVDPVMTRLSLKIHQWQLGRDDDNSFVGFPNLPAKLAEIKAHLDRFGQEIELGLGWHWLYESPEPAANRPRPWQFLSYRVDPPFTHTELREHLRSNKKPGTKQWISLRPLDRRQYSLRQRVVDLIQRMIAAQRGGADAIFVPDPFHPNQGLLHQSGLPNEIFLPWRTTALALGGTRYVGSIQMPRGSTNHIFERGGEAIMIVWNYRPVQEVLYLGNKIQIEDVWGKTVATRTRPVRNGRGFVQQIIPVGTMPTFVRGVNASIAKWRMSFKFPNDQLESIFGHEQMVKYQFKNAFPQGVGGTVTVDTPWDATENSQQNFKIPEREQGENNFNVTLNSNAASGSQPVRIIFELAADRKYRFRVFRNLIVGSKDVTVELVTSLNENGDLVVEQHLTNLTNQFVSFTCTVFVDGRKRKRKRIVNLARGRITLPFIFPNGKELIGQRVSLRAEEVYGSRILNYHVVAER